MLGEGLNIKPNLSSMGCMAMCKNVGLVVNRDLIPSPSMIKIAGLIGFGALLILETEERAILF